MDLIDHAMVPSYGPLNTKNHGHIKLRGYLSLAAWFEVLRPFDFH